MSNLHIPRRFFRRLSAEIKTQQKAHNGEQDKQRVFAKKKDITAIIISTIAIIISSAALFVSYKNFQTASNSLKISNRAYVLVESAKLIEQKIVHDTVYAQIIVSFKNFGSKPSLKTKILVQVEVFQDSIPKRLVFKKTGGMESETVVAPNAVFNSVHNKFIPKATVDEIKSRKKIVCVFGIVVYKDIFGDDCKTKFCFVYDIAKGGFNIYAMNNEIE